MKILLVEDDEVDAEQFRRMAGDAEVEVVSTAAQAEKRLVENGIDAVVSDLGLPDSHGLEVVARLSKFEIPILVATGSQDETMLTKAVELGAIGAVFKGDPPESIAQRLTELNSYVEAKAALADCERPLRDAIEAVLCTIRGRNGVG